VLCVVEVGVAVGEAAGSVRVALGWGVSAGVALAV
jgi:hypothetical protein